MAKAKGNSFKRQKALTERKSVSKRRTNRSDGSNFYSASSVDKETILKAKEFESVCEEKIRLEFNNVVLTVKETRNKVIADGSELLKKIEIDMKKVRDLSLELDKTSKSNNITAKNVEMLKREVEKMYSMKTNRELDKILKSVTDEVRKKVPLSNIIIIIIFNHNIHLFKYMSRSTPSLKSKIYTSISIHAHYLLLIVVLLLLLPLLLLLLAKKISNKPL